MEKSIIDEIGLTYDLALLLDRAIGPENMIERIDRRLIVNNYPNLYKYIQTIHGEKENTFKASIILVLAVEEVLAKTQNKEIVKDRSEMEIIKNVLIDKGYTLQHEEHKFQFKKDRKTVTLNFTEE